VLKYHIITPGTPESTQAVIITEIPLPIQTSVITSHNHIKNIVPEVITVIAIKTVFVSDISTIVHHASVFKSNIIPYD
jgi:hypothetical protein